MVRSRVVFIIEKNTGPKVSQDSLLPVLKCLDNDVSVKRYFTS